MAHDGRLERRVVFVTGIALRRRRNMGGRLKHSRRATSDVTRRTISRCRSGVSKRRPRPYRRRRVTGVALGRCCDMRRRLCLRVHRCVRTTVTG